VLKPESFPIEKIYVPVKTRKALKPGVVQEIAESILEIGQQAPILIRADEDRFVLVEGLHRLEACKALGETTIMGLLVSAENAHYKAHLPQSLELEAERQKMERLRKLRLEKEVAEKLAVSSSPVTDTETPGLAPEHRNRLITTPRQSGRGTSASKPKTLSEWRAQQDRNNGQY
jgi:uncharacterized ParB-like nuclease family protein